MKFNKVFVLCPKGVKTGGPELLHQLVFEINQVYGADSAKIAYYGDLSATPVPEYDKYINGKYIDYEKIEDESTNVIIFPETSFTALFNKFHYAKKYIWWLSIDNYFAYNSPSFSIKSDGLVYSLGRFLKGHLKNNLNRDRNKFMNADLHLCQSIYAKDYLNKKEHISTSKIKYLSDYINDLYVEVVDDSLKKEKKDVVLYNPKKGLKFTKKIIKAAKNKNWKWVALKGMSNLEVQNYLTTSKVYIDFGNHPGKDRFPREAAISGCCVITDKKGAANYFEDLPIPDKYKFEDKESNINKIINEIGNCINDYDIAIKDFENYRNYIKGEKKAFRKDIINVFGK